MVQSFRLAHRYFCLPRNTRRNGRWVAGTKQTRLKKRNVLSLSQYHSASTGLTWQSTATLVLHLSAEMLHSEPPLLSHSSAAQSLAAAHGAQRCPPRLQGKLPGSTVSTAIPTGHAAYTQSAVTSELRAAGTAFWPEEEIEKGKKVTVLTSQVTPENFGWK